jgi:hypothetical protein
MTAPDQRDELLWQAIESGTLDESLAADTDIAKAFAAHRKLESLFGILRRPVTVAPEPQGAVARPTQIGRHQVERELGQGAFGVVYLGYDPELNRPVAIKVPRPERFSSPDDAERFMEEARAAAALNHPGIVTVHDVGRQGAQCYIVLEYIHGRTLEEMMQAGRVPPAQAAGLVARVADALHYAHKKGFVHRDLKPGNILLDDQDNPHVTDLGLAVSEESQELLAGQIAGTPAYMSPEQVRGETHRLDGRTDIWSLGVLLYQLLTGRHPFWREGSSTCLDEIVNREPKPPRQIDDTVPVELERITLKCLAKPVTERYNTAADLAHDLRHWRPSPHDGDAFDHAQASRLPERRFGALPQILVAAAVLAIVLAVGFFLRSRPEHGAEGVGPLAGTINVRLWDPKNAHRQGLSMDEPGALPLHPGDQIRLEITASRPSYLYVVWITSDNEIAPVYPWSPGKWGERPPQEKPISTVSLPEGVDTRWPMKGPDGMETLVLLGRDTPMPDDVDLKQLFSGFPKQQIRDPRAIVSLDSGRIAVPTERGPEFLDPRKADDPVAKAQRFLLERLQPHFQLVRAVSFAVLKADER